MAKLRVGLLFGGRSVEHEVSIASATSILSALDPSRYDVRLIAVDTEGRWHLGAGDLPPELIASRGDEVIPPTQVGQSGLLAVDGGADPTPLDVIFPIIHGTQGEDGTLQGMLELAGIPYAGARVLGSAVQMDKDIAKRLLAAAGLPVVPWRLLRDRDLSPTERGAAAAEAVAAFGFPLFVKPANSGSSVGTSKVANEEELDAAIANLGDFKATARLEDALKSYIAMSRVRGHQDLRIAQRFAPSLFQQGPLRLGYLFLDVMRAHRAELPRQQGEVPARRREAATAGTKTGEQTARPQKDMPAPTPWIAERERIQQAHLAKRHQRVHASGEVI